MINHRSAVCHLDADSYNQKTGIVITIPTSDPMISMIRFMILRSICSPWLFLESSSGESNRFSSTELRSRMSEIFGTL